ncbi:MAG: universal stress protein [Chitinophagaceae bacterium]|nr:universal stress protein [Chitinophagaceae bacterium]
MNTILALTNFTPISINAVNYAADVAAFIHAELQIINICELPVAFTEVPLATYDVDALVKNAERQLADLKQTVANRLPNLISIETIVKQGDILSEINRYCEELQPFAVVMGAETATSFEQFMFGGKTVSAVHQLQWPIMVVPEDVQFKGIKKIGLACDFKNVIDSVPAAEIKMMVHNFNAELHVVNVYPEKLGGSLSASDVAESGLLQTMLQDLNPLYHFISDNDVEQSINDFADKNELDMLIIIPKKHLLINKIFQHSYSKRMVLQMRVPVLAIHE